MNNQFKSIYDKTLQETIDIHILIENCFTGNNIKDINLAKVEFLSHFHENFYMIGASGVTFNYEKLGAWFPSAYNSRPGNKIEILNFKLHSYNDHQVLVTYEEKQNFANEILHRVSTGILVPSVNTKTGYIYQHLHETWLPKN